MQKEQKSSASQENDQLFSKWKLRSRMRLWQIVALSRGADPDLDYPKLRKDDPNQYSYWLRIARSALSNDGMSDSLQYSTERGVPVRSMNAIVKPSDFVAYARSFWPLPDGFVAAFGRQSITPTITTAPSTTAPSTTAPSTTAPSTTAPSTTADAIPTTTGPRNSCPQQSKDHVSHTDKEPNLHPRKKNNLLKMIDVLLRYETGEIGYESPYRAAKKVIAHFRALEPPVKLPYEEQALGDLLREIDKLPNRDKD